MIKANNGNEIKTWQDCEAAMQAYAAAKCEESIALAAQQEAILHAQECYREGISDARARAEDQEALLKKFAAAHKKEFKAREDGGEGRTRVVAGIEIGYQWGKPYIHIPKRFEEEAIGWLEETAADTYVKRSPKVMREVLLAELGKAEENGDRSLIDRMAANHITREQDEEFVLRPKEQK